MSGDEDDSEMYRLGTAMYGLAHYDHIVEANVQRFNNRGDTLQWAASVSLSPHEVQEVIKTNPSGRLYPKVSGHKS